MTDQTSKLIAIYARVSTSLQENEGTVENQLMALREHAQRTGSIVVREYVDDGWSGDILARPALDELRQDAKNKMWDAVLIYDPDRLARRYSYQELVMDELREIGVEILFMTVEAPRDPGEKILHGVRGLFAEYERAKISERFRLGKVRKARSGHVLVSEAPYGYRYIPRAGDVHGRYQVDVAEAPIVKKIFEWVAYDGLTVCKVVKKLQELEMRPRKSKRGVWNVSTLISLVRNTTYIGEAHWGRTYAVVPQKPLKNDKYRKIRKSSRKAKPKVDWIVIPVPAIVDRDIFEQAQRQLSENFALARRNRKNQYLLSGRIRCACGRTRTGEGEQGGRYLYYRCSDKSLSFPLPPACKERGVNARIADELVWQRTVGLMCSAKLLNEQAALWARSRAADGQHTALDTAPIKIELTQLKCQEERYNKAYAAGLYSLNDLKEYLVPIKQRKIALERQIANAMPVEKNDDNRAAAIPSFSELQAVADEARTLLIGGHLKFDDKRAIVLDVVDKIVAGQGKLQVYGHIPLPRYGELYSDDRRGEVTIRHRNAPSLPFELTIAVPSPQRRGVDYGFLPGSNKSQRGSEDIRLSSSSEI